MPEPEPKIARGNLLDIFLDGKDRDFRVESEVGEKPMPEPEPMSWEGAEAWEKAGPYPNPSHSAFHARLREAIALARQEKERGDEFQRQAKRCGDRIDLADKLAEAVEKFIENDGCAAGGEAIPVCDALRTYRGINNDASS